MGQTESRIAVNEKNALQAFYLAESGAAVVQSWFDRPGIALSFPPPGVVRRTLREVLDETDPYVGVPTAGTQYKQIAATSTDVDLDGDGMVDLFRPPYRGGDGVEHAFMGVAAAPDLVIDDADSDSAMGLFLEELSRKIIGPAFDAPGRRGKISRIAIYAPPYVPSSGNWTRYGMATIEVTARIYRLDVAGLETAVLAERTVKTVLNEIPYGTPVFGPLHSCGDLEFSGQLSAHWGAVTTGGNLVGYDDVSEVALSVPRRNPPGPRLDRLWVDTPGKEGCVQEYNSRAHGQVVADPWLRVVALDTIVDAPLGVQPYPSIPDTYPHLGSCDPGETDPLDCCDRSNLIQGHELVLCPEYDYEFWKSIASSGRSDVHYFVPHPAGTIDLFKEGGVGDWMTFKDATDGKTGLFFFETTDSLPPLDDDLDGVLDNVVDAVITVSGDWQAVGFIYLNAREFGINGPLTPPQNVLVRAPGESYLDANNNRLYDAGEAWVNLEYLTTAGGSFKVHATEDTDDMGGVSASGAMRNAQSPFEVALPVSFAGILYTSGDVTAVGGGIFYGSVIARGKITLGGAGGAPDFYWDERIFRRWPPLDEDGLPRVVATRWIAVP